MKILIGETFNYKGKLLTVTHRNEYLSPKSLKFIKGDKYTCIYFDSEDEEFHGITLTSAEIESNLTSNYYNLPIPYFSIGDQVKLKSGSPDLLIENFTDDQEVFLTISYHKRNSELVYQGFS